MRPYRLGWLLVPLLLSAAAPPPVEQEVARLVAALGSDRFEEREAATQALKNLGRIARVPLRKFRDSDDLEVRRRIREVLDHLTPLRRAPLVLAAGTSDVYAVAYSPDGSFLATGDWSPAVHLWDSAGKRSRSLKGHTALIRQVVITPDGKHVVSCSLDRTVRVWEAATGKLVHTLTGHLDNVIAVSLSRDGKRIVSGGNDHTVRVWDLATGKGLTTLRDSDRCWCGNFSKDGRQVICSGGNKDFRLRVYDVGTGKQLRTLAGHTREVHGFAVSPDGTRVASASWDGTVRIWDLATGKSLHTLDGHGGEARCVCYSADGTRLASGDAKGQVILWHAASGRLLRRLEGHANMVNAVAFSPDGERLVSGGSDGKARVWDVLDD